MNVTAAQHDLPRRNPDDATSREEPLQKRRRGAIAVRIKERHDDAAVGDVEVDIARRQPLPGAARRAARTDLHAARLPRGHRKRSRHRQLVHRDTPSAGITRVMQALPGVTRNAVLRIASVVGPREAHHPGRAKQASSSICPSVSSLNTPSPSHTIAAHAQVGAQMRLDLRTTRASDCDWR